MTPHILSREIVFQTRIHECRVKHSAFTGGITTTERRKESFRKVIRENNLQEKLGAEFEALYGEPL